VWVPFPALIETIFVFFLNILLKEGLERVLFSKEKTSIKHLKA